MKTALTLLAIVCTASMLCAQTPNTTPFPSTLTPKPGLGTTPAAKTIKLLDPTEKEHWKEQLGEWKFESEKLTGTGASGIIYNRSFKVPFQMTFGFEMIEGTRPAISGFGRYNVMTEGTGTHLAIFPVVPKGGSFKYELKKKYRVRIDLTAEKIELRINNKLVDTRKPGVEVVPPIRFSAGDGYSQGVARFTEIEVTAAPVE